MTQSIDLSTQTRYPSSIMPRWLWILLALVISTTVYFTIRYGLRPKPIPVLNPTQFQHLEQVGVVIYKRLRQNIRSERVVLLGSGEGVKGDAEIWAGLLKGASADKESIVYFVREGVEPVPDSAAWETHRFMAGALSSGDLLKEVQARSKGGQLVIVHAHTDEVTHLVPNSLSRQVDRLLRHPVLSLSTLPLVVNLAEHDDLQPECVNTVEGNDRRAYLDCAAFKVARKFLKKKLAPDKLWAVMERHGLKEYLVFIHQP
ncbi:MAG: hypothetical protein AB7G93_14275 [Bdellovibrionales bacterium]